MYLKITRRLQDGTGRPQNGATVWPTTTSVFFIANGQGVHQDYKEARRWIKKSAEQGKTRTFFNLGILYLKRLGGPQDYIQAHLWLRLAADDGDLEAARLVADVSKVMTAAQLKEARQLHKSWKPKPLPASFMPCVGP